MSAGELPRRRWGRSLSLLALAWLLWTFLVCYPNPAVFFRNLARYRHFPLDPRLESRMQWQLPADPVIIEAFVDRELPYAPDWRTYRVPWYMPDAEEAATAGQGDCESKAVLLASLLAGKHTPFEIRASFDHIWVDYKGRKPQAGETPNLAYLEGKEGRLGLHWPRVVQLADTLRVQKELLWDVMPPFRKLILVTGLLWLALLASALTVSAPACALESRWRASFGSYVLRSAVVGCLLFAVVSYHAWWGPADLVEAVVASALLGAFATWLVARYLRRQTVSVALEADGIVSYWRRGPWRRRQPITADEIRHLQLTAPSGAAKPWRVEAMLRTGRLTPLLCFRSEIDARQAVQQLGRHLYRPVVVRSERMELQIDPEQIGRPLAEARAVNQPAALSAPPQPLDLVAKQEDGVWTLQYPEAGRTARLVLLLMALLPAAICAVATLLLTRLDRLQALWIVWVLAGAFLAMTVYVMLALKEEMVTRLSGAKIEVGEGELRFHTPERRVERVALSSIESVELGSKGELPTVAVVCHERVVHISGFGSPEERPWVREMIEDAIVSAARSERRESKAESNDPPQCGSRE